MIKYIVTEKNIVTKLMAKNGNNHEWKISFSLCVQP